MARTVLDVTRLLTRASHAVATGVDRVELAYARRALAAPAETTGFAAIVGKRSAPLGQAGVEALVGALAAKWRRGGGDAASARGLADRLGVVLPGCEDAPSAGGDRAFRLALRLRAEAVVSSRRPAVVTGDVYVHVSHIRLDRPEAFSALRTAGARLSVLVHDLIPIRFPEYGREGEAGRHARRMGTALDHATALIANSAETARDLAGFARETGRAPPPIVTAPLGLEADFARRGGATAAAGARPYFVALGTIEPRKNHLLLLHCWRRLAARLGDATPTLALVGRRGWENEMVLDMLERSPAIRAHVVEANDLPDVALAGLVQGARALLFPSFAEGYGLPLAEALALGAPAIASDLAVFREVAGDAAERLDPLDGPAWETAVVDYLDDGPRRAAALARASAFEPSGWDTHFKLVADVTGL